MQKIAFLVLVFCFFIFRISAQISVKTVDSIQNPMADSLVRTLVGYGVSIFNVKSNISQRGKSVGSFRSSHPAFPFSSGLLMSSGLVDSIPRPNRSGPASTRIPYTDTLAGCAEGRWLLTEILKRQSNNGIVQKATEMSTIRFDLVPVGDSLKFNYLFASEEYPEFVCSQFNDIFGFFIKGPGITGDSIYEGTSMAGFRNMARIPNSGLPVAINTVNAGQPGSNGVQTNCQFTPEGMAVYAGNENTGSPLFHALAFDGLTKTLTAKAAVMPCQVYTLVLVVSDVGDRIYDSGVFLERGSMVSGKFDAIVSSAGGSDGDTLTGCHPVKLTFRRCPNITDKWVIRFTQEGSAIPNVDYKRKMPDGELVNVPDSIVLHPGQPEANIELEAVGNGMATRNLVFRYLEVNQPFVNGQPNYGGSETHLPVRPRKSQPTQQISVCWNDTSRFSFLGPVPSGESYHWHELINGQLSETSKLSCVDCRNPVIQMDTVSRIFVLETHNTTNACSRFDTVTVKARRFLLPVFITEGNTIEMMEREVGYTYRWSVNGVPVGSDSANQLAFEPGDEVKIEITSPNGCRALLTNTNLFTSVEKNESQDYLMVYPNPASQEVTVSLPGNNGNFEISLLETSGKEVLSKTGMGTCRLSLEAVPSGFYILRTVDPKGNVQQTRLSVAK